MTTYNNFLGIDIGKFNFVVATHGRKETKEFENTPNGINKFFKQFASELVDNCLCVLETTGGYEMELLLTICKKQIAVHRANTRHVKHFIRSLGNAAKTDALDAKALALYGSERGNKLVLFSPPSEGTSALSAFYARRTDLKKLLVAEKNRSQSTRDNVVKGSCKAVIKTIEEQIAKLDQQINKLIGSDKNLHARKEVLKEIPGVGDVTANSLLIAMPELGTLNHKEVASLAGLAPIANDSGRKSGYRSTNKGRSIIKPILFTAAMAASKSHSVLGSFYDRLILNGKKKMVALTALMRKILVIANSKLKDLAAGKPTMRILCTT
jgi:transposase